MIRRRALRRGSGFFMFLLVLLPFTLLGVALGADYSRALLAKRQATNAADVIAMAAATSFSEGGDLTTLDPSQAAQRALEMFNQAVTTGMLPSGLKARLSDVEISTDRSTVTVTVDFEVPELFIVGAIAPNAVTKLSGKVRRAASVCLPDDPRRQAEAGCAYPIS
jgi:Flp pilus assembly protein TadG